ncbi:MAG: hypothetical protein H7068_04675 [Pedobacter sp.]|nr:hypothetical protein [Chitinophagaceae bacterium]
MNFKKILLPGIAGGVVFFFLGYLFYAVLFKNVMVGPIAGVERPMDQIVWWSLMLGCVLYGVLLAFILAKSNDASLITSIITAATVGFLATSYFDFTMHATTYLLGKKALICDVAISTVMSAITGAVIAFVAGLGSKKSV